MDLVPKFNAEGIAPFSLGGAVAVDQHDVARIPFDRVRGPDVFQAAFEGEPNAWSHPAAIDGLTKAQELIEANGFIKGFSSITADSNADQALLYTGKAAMMVHGTWTYGSMGGRRWRLRLGWQARPPELPARRGR